MKNTVLIALIFAAKSFCQTPSTEPTTLQSLLGEVHQLRVDIEAMTAASQRVQIALYTLQMQDAAVARASQRVDSTRNACKAKEENRQHFESEVSRTESELASGTSDAARLKILPGFLAEQKRQLELVSVEAQACQASESEASSQLRNDQAKLTELQDRIERLDKKLEQLSVTGK
jgi:chromosome segregation ATPase